MFWRPLGRFERGFRDAFRSLLLGCLREGCRILLGRCSWLFGEVLGQLFEALSEEQQQSICLCIIVFKRIEHLLHGWSLVSKFTFAGHWWDIPRSSHRFLGYGGSSCDIAPVWAIMLFVSISVHVYNMRIKYLFL